MSAKFQMGVWTVENDRGNIRLLCGNDNSGITIELRKKDRTIHVWGHYDSCVGIQGGQISVDDLLELFKPLGYRTQRRKHEVQHLQT